MNRNRSYQIAISPIITEYRCMRQRRNRAMETPMTSPTAPPSDLPADHPLQPSPSDSPQTVQILLIVATPSPPNELKQLVTAYLIEHPPDATDNESTNNSPSPSFKSFEPDQETRTLHWPHMSCRNPLDSTPRLCQCDKGQIGIFSPGGPPEYCIIWQSLWIPTILFRWILVD